jgi:membrane fusion protein (multidrug efflux system)
MRQDDAPGNPAGGPPAPRSQAPAAPDGARPKEAEAGRRGPKLSGPVKLALLAAAIVALVAAGFLFVRHQTYGRYFQKTDDATLQADAVTVAPRVNGYVAQVFVADNQDVAAGQPLVRIDPRNYQAQAAQAEAQIGEAAAAAANADATVREQQATIAQTQAQLAAAQAKAAQDAAEVARYTPLAATGAETRQQLDQLRLTARQSAENVRAQGAALTAQQRRVAGLQAQVRQAQAQGKAAQAQLAAAGVDVEATLLRAAIAGRVGDKTVTLGQYVQAGTRLMSVVPLNQLYLVANFKETQLALMRAGQPATITVDALGGVELRGRVASVSPGTGSQFSLLPPQNATGNFTKIVQRVPVRIALEASPAARRLLVPGLSVNVSVDTRSAKGELERIRDGERQAQDRRGRA